MLNEHSLTISDIRNQDAKNHVGHNVRLLETKTRNAGLPYRRLTTERFLCQTCQKIYYEYNYTDNEELRSKIPPTEIIK